MPIVTATERPVIPTTATKEPSLDLKKFASLKVYSNHHCVGVDL